MRQDDDWMLFIYSFFIYKQYSYKKELMIQIWISSPLLGTFFRKFRKER